MLKKGGMFVDKYLATVSKKLVDEVRDNGLKIEDSELALITLDGLDNSYDTFVTVVTTSVGELSFSKIKGLLILEGI